MNNLIAALSGAVVLFMCAPEREPMSYNSVEDYNFWRLHMYDHFGD